MSFIDEIHANEDAGGVTDVFERGDLLGVVAAMNTRKSFYRFVVARFLEVAASGYVFETTTGVKVTVNDQPEDVWNDWRVPASFEDGYASLLVQADYIPIQRILVGDRGEVKRAGAIIMFDTDILFGERFVPSTDEAADYETYLSLKARFEPTA